MKQAEDGVLRRGTVVTYEVDLLSNLVQEGVGISRTETAEDDRGSTSQGPDYLHGNEMAGFPVLPVCLLLYSLLSWFLSSQHDVGT